MPRPSDLAGAADRRTGQGVGRESKQSAGGPEEGGTGRRCPICGKPAQAATRPFCSKRCRDVDLNRWLSGAYVVPGAESEDDGSE
jgi:endogenous inhibitor of DNA gyrase (YacG/DUF329 family)